MTKKWCSYHETKHSTRKIHKIQRTTMSNIKFKKGEVIAVRGSEDPKAYWRYDTFQRMTEYGLYETSLWVYPFARKLNAEERGE